VHFVIRSEQIGAMKWMFTPQDIDRIAKMHVRQPAKITVNMRQGTGEVCGFTHFFADGTEITVGEKSQGLTLNNENKIELVVFSGIQKDLSTETCYRRLTMCERNSTWVNMGVSFDVGPDIPTHNFLPSAGRVLTAGELKY